MTTAERLLQTIDRLPYPQRQRLLADTARDLAGTPELRDLLTGLDELGPFGRRTALFLAVIAEDRGHVLASLGAPEPGVRAGAIAAAVKLDLPHPVLLAALPDLPADHRATLYRALRARSATDLAEVLQPTVQELFGDHEAAGLLSAVSHQRCASLLPDLDHAVANWASLGNRHPAQLLSYVEARLSAEPTALWQATWWQVGPAVAAALPSDPGSVLDLLERSVEHAAFPAALVGHLGALARFDPARMLRLLTDPRRRGRVHLGRKTIKAFAGLPDDDLVALARMMDEAGRLPAMLHALPPSRRAVLHDAVVGGRDPGARGLAPALAAIDELPAAARDAEARRLLAVRGLADDPRTRLDLTARLDWSSAQPTLLEATKAPLAEDRAHAWSCLVTAAARSRRPAVVTELLGSMDRVRNDQDTVRSGVLTALAGISPWLFDDTDAAAVATKIADGAAARDASWATTSAMQRWCQRLLVEGLVHAKPALVRVAVDGLGLLASHRSSPGLHGVADNLPHGGEHDVFEALRPRIEADAARGDFGIALELAQALGRRAWAMPRLQSYVDRARSATDDHVVRNAIRLWLAPPATRDARVAQVLKGDRSTITIREVSDAVGFRRTDLLDDVFRRSMRGRFLKRGVRLVPPFDRCVDRWVPRHVAAYSKLLASVATATRLPVWERTSATRSLARVPGNLALLSSLAEDSEVSVAEAAIAGLAWTEDPTDSLPRLASFAQTDRARVAVPAITRAARFVRPRDLPATLQPLLVGAKITSRKEAVRLLAEQRIPGAAQLLLDAFDLPEQHRDVRRAIATAARFHLDDPVTWDLLDRAVAHPAVATAVLEVTVGTVARRHRAAYAALVQRVAGSDDPDTARLGLAALPGWLPWRPEGTDMLVATVADLTHSATWRAALAALAAGSTITGSGSALVELARSLAAADDDSLDGPDRDRPAHQRLSALIEATLSAVSSGSHRALAVEVGEALAPLQPSAAIRLLAAGLDFTSVDPIVRICSLADRPTLAVLARSAVAQAFAQVVRRLPGRAVELASRVDTASVAGGLVALALAETAGPAEGWPADLRAVVRDLRGHPDLDVREAALGVALAPE